MTRRHVSFACEGVQLVGTLDEADGTTGLLIVSGGNEIRAGAFAGQAQLAARIAKEGFPVFRFDRRGVGDSEGANAGFRDSGPDIAAALAALHSEAPQLERVVAFGNCDAASALMLSGGDGFSGLILSNPWTFETDDADDAPPEAVRAHYRGRLRDPAAIRRLLTGKVSLGKLAGSVLGMLRPAPPASTLSQDMALGIGGFAGNIRFLIAERDRTGLAFLSAWDKADPRLRRCANATHAYAEPQARDWLTDEVLDALRA